MANEWPKSRSDYLAVLYKQGGHSYDDMAGILGVTKNAVAGRIGRMRAAQRREQFKLTGKHTKLPRKPRKDRRLWFKPIRPAPRAHPLFRGIIKLCNEQQVSRRELCARVNISESTFDNYRTRYEPKLTVIEAMYNVFDKTLLVPTDRED